MTASDAAPVINARAKFERWIDFISAPPPPPHAAQPDNIRLQFEHLKTEISRSDHMRV
jgi:hypothetical protein